MAGMRVAEQSLGHGFDHTGLARSRRPQNNRFAHRPARGVKPGEKHLVDSTTFSMAWSWPTNAAAEGGFKLSRIRYCGGWDRVQWPDRSHKVACPVLSKDLSLSRAVFSGYCPASCGFLLAFLYHQTVASGTTKTVIPSCTADRIRPVGSVGNSKSGWP